MANKRHWLYSNRWPMLVLVLGLGGTSLLAWILDQFNEEELQLELRQSSEEAASRLNEELAHYQYALTGNRSLILAAQELRIDRAALRRYYLSSYVDRSGLSLPTNAGFARLKYSGSLRTSDDLAKATLAVEYLYAFRDGDDYRLPTNVDIANLEDPARRALTSGRAYIAWFEDRESQQIAIMQPVYRGGETPENLDARLAEAVGVVFSAVSPRPLIDKLNAELAPYGVALESISGEGFRALEFPVSEPVVTHQTMLLNVFGQRWTLRFAAFRGFVKEHQRFSPAATLFAGGLVTLLIATMLWLTVLNNQRRQQILNTRVRLAEIVESSADGIISKDLEGVVTSWNRGAQAIFGYTAEQAVGHSLAELVVPDDLLWQERDILGRIARGEGVSSLRTRRQHKDGQMVEVEVTVSPIRDASGAVVGASKTVRDISEHMEAVRRVHELNASLERQVSERTEALQQLNMTLRSVLDSASEVSIIATDTSGIITLFNRGAERLLGYSAEEVVGKLTPAQVVHDEEEVRQRAEELRSTYGVELEGFRALVYAAEQGDGGETRDWIYRRRDGTRVPVSLMITVMRNDDDSISGYLGIAVNVAEQRAAERKLAASLETTRAILDTAVNPIITIDAYGTIRSCNPAGERALGYQADEIIGRNVKMLMPAPFSREHDGYLSRFRANGSGGDIAIDREVEARRKDGSLFPVQISLGAMRVGGEPMVVGIMSDITEQRRQRDEVISARDQLALAAKVARIGIWTWDIQNNTLAWSERMFEIYGQPKELADGGLLYEHWASRLHPEDAKATVSELERIVREKRTLYSSMFRIVLPSGAIRYIKAVGQVELAADGSPLKVTGINLDVTDEQELQASLRDAKEQADAASAAKSFFLANMSHEIRTPMNAVLGMLYLAQQTDLNPRQRDYIGKARSAATSLLGLLNDILDYSKIEAGKLSLDAHEFELEPLLQELGIVLSGNQGKKPVELLFDIDPQLPSELFGDRLRLQQVLINLAGNALKFTEQGQVVVGVRLLAREPQEVRLRFSVSDTGIGISEEQMTRIFSGFTQAEASTSRRFGGTGLGLVISKRLIELMGGRLELQSALGSGSRFWFDLSLPFARQPSLRETYPLTDQNLQVLIVDDNDVAGGMLVATTQALGWQPEYVQDGDAALRQVEQRFAQGKRYDVVLMDWRMPGLDGRETARQILAVSPPGKAPAVLMITAYGQDQLDQDDAEEASGLRLLSKPVTPQQIAQAVQYALHGEDPRSAEAHRPAEQPLRGMHLLVVEDNELNRQVAFELLRAEGAEVELAEDGRSGVKAVTDSVRRFDAVLMDMQMPEVDGLEATRRIRRDPRFARLPIIAMTANASDADRQQCLDAGMDDHLAKPIEKRQLIARLLQYVAGVEPSVLLGQDAGESTEITSYAALLERFAGNHGLLQQMLDTFSRDIPKRLARARQHLDQGERSDAGALLHGIKGSAGTMGAMGLYRRSAEFERRLRDAPAGVAHPIGEGELDELEQLFRDNLAQLQQLLADQQGEAQPASSGPSAPHTALSAQALRVRLERLGELLRASNLEALEFYESLRQEVDETQHDELIQLAESIRALDFAGAAQQVEQLLAENGEV